MFTGIIEEMGTIKNVKRNSSGAIFSINTDNVINNLGIGESIAINGTCLTVVKSKERLFDVELSPETLERTTFSNSKIGNKVNLERAMKIGDRLSGHLVSGHIDGVGTLVDIKEIGNSFVLRISAPMDYMRYLIPKGSVAIDGISLTVVEISDNEFTVSIIPHTWKNTTLACTKIHTEVNLEFDIVAKYIERFTMFQTSNKKIDLNYLQAHGFI